MKDNENGKRTLELKNLYLLNQILIFTYINISQILILPNTDILYLLNQKLIHFKKSKCLTICAKCQDTIEMLNKNKK